MIWVIAFLSLLIIVTYLVYPFSVILFANLKSLPKKIENSIETPRVFLLMAAHNEEKVIEEKLNSVLNSSFDLSNLICYIGSDNSTDGTEEIIRSFQSRLNLKFFDFDKRQGKPAIINRLVQTINNDYKVTDQDLFLLTDANVIFHTDFIQEISSSFNNPKVGLVDGYVLNPTKSRGSGESERVYVALETKIKKAESIIWGCSMGPFGGAFMMRAKLYTPVPSNFLVDDFFIFYQIAKEGYQSIVNEKAICYEEVSGNLNEEFRRKARISAGNFQNAAYFSPEIIKFWKKHNLIFILHKLLRWLTPLFAIVIAGLLIFMGIREPIAINTALIMISLLVGIPLANYLLNQLNLNFKLLQGVSYLIIMNIALLVGFFKFLKGIKSNVWKPTKRTISAS